jgi:exoribonuclease R
VLAAFEQFARWLAVAYSVASDILVLRSTLDACGRRLPRELADLTSVRQMQQRVVVFEDSFHADVVKLCSSEAVRAASYGVYASFGTADAVMAVKLGSLSISGIVTTTMEGTAASKQSAADPQMAPTSPTRMLQTLAAAAWLARHLAAVHPSPPLLLILAADDVPGPECGALGGSVSQTAHRDMWEAACMADALLQAAFGDVRVDPHHLTASQIVEGGCCRGGVAVLSLARYADLLSPRHTASTAQEAASSQLPESAVELLAQLREQRAAAVGQAAARLQPALVTPGESPGSGGQSSWSFASAAQWLQSRAGHLFPAHVALPESGRSLHLSPVDAVRLLGPECCAHVPSATTAGIQLLEGVFHRSRTARNAGWVVVKSRGAAERDASAMDESADFSQSFSHGGVKEVKVIGDAAQNRALEGDSVLVACLPLRAISAALRPYYITGRPLSAWERVEQLVLRCTVASPMSAGLDVLDLSVLQDEAENDTESRQLPGTQASSAASHVEGTLFGIVLGIVRRKVGLVVATPQADPDDSASSEEVQADKLAVAQLASSDMAAGAAGSLSVEAAPEITSSNADTGGSVYRILVIPMDDKLPKIRIRTRQQFQKLKSHRILVQINDWPSTSLYPSGHYVSTIGKCLDLDTEVRCIMLRQGVDAHSRHFPRAALASLPVLPASQRWSVAWHIQQRVRATLAAYPSMSPDAALLKEQRELEACRRDLRWTHSICSIDPPGCTDIDDALSVRTLPNGNVEVGVHIADVTAFVARGSDLDTEARARATTVYLVDRRLDMLPRLLSENVCSLRARVDRFAVSVLWELIRRPDSNGTPQFEILQDRTWIGRTIIRSTHALTYEQGKRLVAGLSANAEIRQAPVSRLAVSEDPASHIEAWKDPLEADCADFTLCPHPRILDPAAYAASALAVRQSAAQSYAHDPSEGGTCGAPVAAEDEPELSLRLRTLTSVAQWLAHKRAAAGAVEFDSAEVRFLLQVRDRCSVAGALLVCLHNVDFSRGCSAGWANWLFLLAHCAFFVPPATLNFVA